MTQRTVKGTLRKISAASERTTKLSGIAVFIAGLIGWVRYNQYWAFIITLVLFPFVTFSFSYYFLLSLHRVLTLTALAIAFSIIALIYLGPKFETPRSPDFSISETTFALNLSPGYWFVEDVGHGDRHATKILGGVLVQFTNLKTNAVMIDRFMVEYEATNGEWRTMETVTPGGFTHGRIFYGADLKNMRELKYKTFESAADGKQIAPYETIRGWLFYKNLPAQQKGKRFEFMDVKTGKVCTEPFTPSIKEDFHASGGAWPVQSQLFEYPTNEYDISLIPQW